MVVQIYHVWWKCQLNRENLTSSPSPKTKVLVFWTRNPKTDLLVALLFTESHLILTVMWLRKPLIIGRKQLKVHRDHR